MVKFKTLAAASKYIQNRWQGVEYKDGASNFHTDYYSYELKGFEFKDIGKTIYHSDDPYDRTFEFFEFDELTDTVKPKSPEMANNGPNTEP